MHESAVAEPEAVWRAVCRFARPSDKVVSIMTDHSPLVAPSKAGYAKGWNPNLLMLRLHAAFCGTRFVVSHVAGISNPSDEASRGGAWNWTLVQAAMRMASAEQRGELAQSAEYREGEAEPTPAHNINTSERQMFMI